MDLHLSVLDNCNLRLIFEQFPINFVVHFRIVLRCTWSPLQTATSRTLYELTSNLVPPVSCQCCPFSHIKTRQHKARGLQSLEDVVSRELGASYNVQHLLDAGPIMLTPVAGGGGGVGVSIYHGTQYMT